MLLQHLREQTVSIPLGALAQGAGWHVMGVTFTPIKLFENIYL
jgi:hypothetical protein